MATQPTVQISIHASAKEATLDEQKPFKVVLYISIHASAKEATKSTTATTAAKKISIHASAKEATVYNGTIDWKKVKFQSTPPRRRRQSAHPPINRLGQFQSTPPRRRRRNEVVEDMTYYISIHASAKEATATYCDTSAIMYISSLNNFFVHFF